MDSPLLPALRISMSETLATIKANLRAMSRLVFLRHAHSTANEKGILSGRIPGITLTQKGVEQSLNLIERLGESNFEQIRVSPLERCALTIEPWLKSQYSQGFGLYQIDDNLNEVDYGKWSGRKLSRLSKETLWKTVQEKPSKVTFPAGEKMKNVQQRALRSVQESHQHKKTGNFLFVSHGDVIKSVVASLVGLPLDSFQNLIINPASLTVIDFDGSQGRLLSYSDTTTCIAPLLTKKKIGKALLGGGSGLPRAGKK